MNSWKKFLITALVLTCLGCQSSAKKTVQLQETVKQSTQTPPAAEESLKPAETAPSVEPAPVNPNIEKLNKLLAEVAVYDYDKSRLPLVETSELIRTASTEDKKLIEKTLAEFLKSDATWAAKDFVCRQLSVIGTEQSVPALAAMLANEKTADMARYALERIPDSAVDDALIDTLNKTTANTKIGIINTLGQRRNLKSVAAISSLIYSNDVAIASAAVEAIGNISGFEAAKVLSQAIKNTTGQLRNVVLHAYLDCASRLAAHGERVRAIIIFQQLYDSNEPAQIRIAALRGIVTSAGGQAAGILAEALKKEPAIQSAAISLVREVPAEEILKAGLAELPLLPPPAKVQMLTALSDCGYAAALPAAVTAVKNEEPAVRLAALNAIGKIGNTTNVQLLAETAAISTGDERQAARDNLYRLRGSDVDNAILSALTGAETKIRVELIQAIGQRNITSAAEALLATAKDTDRKTRSESVKALKIIAGHERLSALIELLKNAQSELEAKELEKTVAAVACKSSDENQRSGEIITAMETITDTKTRCYFINVLGKIGGEKCLDAVRAALKDSHAQVQAIALRTLANWSSSEPMADLLEIVKNPPNNIHQVLALRGYIRLIGIDTDRPAQETIMLYDEAMKLSQGVEEKKRILAGLSGIKTYSAIEAAAAYLSDDTLQQEAAAAIVQIAMKTKGEDNPEQTRAALNKVIDIAKTEQLRKQAQDTLNKIK